MYFKSDGWNGSLSNKIMRSSEDEHLVITSGDSEIYLKPGQYAAFLKDLDMAMIRLKAEIFDRRG